MAWYDFLTGTPARTEQVQRFNPQQQSALSQLLGQATSGLPELQKGFNFTPIERQARTGFAQQTVPSIAERFTSMGSGSSLSSPAFASQLGQAGSGLEESLAALKSNVGLQERGRQQSLLLNLLNLGLTPQFESLYHTAQPGALQNLLGVAPQLLLSYLTSGASSAIPGLSGMGASGLANQQGQQGSISGVPSVTSNYGSGFANPALYSSNVQNALRPF